MRTLYSVLFSLLLPFVLIRLFWRSLKLPDYRRRWRERFAFYRSAYPTGVVWFHAVSVGEAEAVFPLVRLFQQQLPRSKILITTTTPTGSARVSAVLGQSVTHVYLPYDVPIVVKRFMEVFKPSLAVIVETEIWPNLFASCGENNIPLYLVNARLSEKSARGYKKIPSLIHPVIANIQLIATQSQDDAERFLAIGASKNQVAVVGNIKFDIDMPELTINEGKQLKATTFSSRFVWLAASTHRGEEALLLSVYKELKLTIPELLLVIAPRHPERFEEVADLCEGLCLKVVKRTAKERCNDMTDVFLANTMGELKMLYAAADLAFIGGSMVEIGGHNLLEALAANVPVLFGPYMANFKEIAEKVLANEAAIQCHDAKMLLDSIRQLYSDSNRCSRLVDNGQLFLQSNRGVALKLYYMLSERMCNLNDSTR